MIRRRVDGVQRDNLAIELSPDVLSMAWESPRRFSVCGAFASTKLGRYGALRRGLHVRNAVATVDAALIVLFGGC